MSEYKAPEWVTQIKTGKEHTIPKLVNEVWQFGELGEGDVSGLLSKAIRRARKFEPAFAKLSPRVLQPARDMHTEELKKAKKDIKNEFAKKYTIFMATWDNTYFVLARVGQELWIISQCRRAVAQEESLENLKYNIETLAGMKLVIKSIPPPEREKGGRCTVASLARAMWIAREGTEIAQSHTIPMDYAVLAQWLIVPPEKENAAFVKYESKIQKPIKNNESVLHPHLQKPLSEVHEKALHTPHKCMRFTGASLKPHQQRVIEFLMHSKKRGMIFFHTVGSGKTITAIAAARCLLRPGMSIVVATPASVKKQFEKEFDKLNIPDIKARTTVVTHEGLATHHVRLVDKNTILIIDEAHNFKSAIRIRTSAAAAAAAKAHKVLLLTATPITNGAQDLAPMLGMIEGITDKKELVALTKRLKKGDDLARLFKCKFSFFQTPMDVKNFPSSSEHYLTFPMDANYYEKYVQVQNLEIEDEKDVMLEDFDPETAKHFYNGIRRAANKMGPVRSSKIDYAIERTIRDVQDGKKVMIYSGFRSNGVHYIREALHERGVDVAFIDGSQPLNKRNDDVQKYNSGEIKVLLITLAGSEGLDLKGTRTVMLIDPWWNVAKIEQIVGRAVRFQSHHMLPKDERHVDVLYLVLVKPDVRNANDSVVLSADEILFRMGENKMQKIGDVYDVIRENAAEKCKRPVRRGSV